VCAGQTEKKWRIGLINDQKYEEAEILRLQLSQPIMGVLEYPNEAIVTIMDPEDGRNISTTLT
jgi:hypothetical protein